VSEGYQSCWQLTPHSLAAMSREDSRAGRKEWEHGRLSVTESTSMKHIRRWERQWVTVGSATIMKWVPSTLAGLQPDYAV